MSARKLIERIVNTGVRGREGAAARRIRVLNAIMILGVLFNIPYAVINIIWGWPAMLPVLAATAVVLVLFVSAIVLNHYQREWLARWITVFTGCANLGVVAVMLGAEAGNQLYLFVVAAAAGAITEGLGWRLHALFAAIPTATFVFVTLAFPEGLTPDALPPEIVHIYGISAIVGTALFIGIIIGLFGWLVEQAEARLKLANQRSERLLLAILPAAVAERLKGDDPGGIAEGHPEVTVVFADIVGFTARSAGMAAEELVARLDQVFSSFDEAATRHGLEKIKTIGDAYMVAAGLPAPQPDHADRALALALDLQKQAAILSREVWPGLKLRVGLHSGPAVAGVIGRTKFAYDVWGDTVNTASRLEEACRPGEVLISDATRECLEREFVLDGPREINLRGKGAVKVYAAQVTEPKRAKARG